MGLLVVTLKDPCAAILSSGGAVYRRSTMVSSVHLPVQIYLALFTVVGGPSLRSARLTSDSRISYCVSCMPSASIQSSKTDVRTKKCRFDS